MADVNEQSTQMNEIANTTQEAQTDQAVQTVETPDAGERLYQQGMQHLIGIGVPRNLSAAADCFSTAVELNKHAKSAYQLGRINAENAIYNTAQEFFSIAAKQGHVLAAYELCLLLHAYKIQASNDQVLAWIEVLAEHNIREAQYLLGRIYFTHANGYVKQSYIEASKWFEKAAEQGHADAQFQLGEMYYVGLGVTQSYTKAFGYYTAAANQGHYDAKCRLGTMYREGEGTEQNLERAEQCYKSVSFHSPFRNQAEREAAYMGGLREATLLRELLTN